MLHLIHQLERPFILTRDLLHRSSLSHAINPIQTVSCGRSISITLIFCMGAQTEKNIKTMASPNPGNSSF